MMDAHQLVAAQLITPFEAVLLCCLQTVIFIAGFFLLKESPILTNDNPIIIRQRLLYIAAVCVACPAGLWLFLSQRGAFSYGLTAAELIGLRWQGLFAALTLPLLLIVILFIGPLTLSFLDEELPFQSHFSFELDFLRTMTSLMGFRNYIAAPFAEELIFRGCCVPLMVMAGFSRTAIILGCPLFFGLAHLHKTRDLYKKSLLYGKKNDSMRDAIQQTVFQCIYTTVFGWFCTFIFLRSGHLIAPILCHSFCNMMGLPAFERISEHQNYIIVIWLAFIVGLVAFFALLFPLTQPAFFDTIFWDTL